MFECDQCYDRFYDSDEFEFHLDYENHWAECESCDRNFRTARASRQHMDATGHRRRRYECETCTAQFLSSDDVDEHMDDSGHRAPRFECETCTRDFMSQHAADQHMDAVDHWQPTFVCETCTREFASQHAVNQHMSAIGHHAPNISCETCDSKFHTQRAADQHMDALGHYLNYCQDCDRHFMNDNNLRMHLNSKIHRGSQVCCPFCRTDYTTASGLAHHLEAGSCIHAPQLNRETILRMVRQSDPDHNITTRQIGWHDNEPTVTYSATQFAFNGHYWECYLCHDEFGKIYSLNSHLNSPVHKQKVYRCPNVTSRCGKEFISLAGLFGHLESETCGYTRFEVVQRRATDVFRTGRLIMS